MAADVVALIEGESLDLIETLAERIADASLARPLVEAVEVIVHKPQAPVGLPFGDVPVHLRRERRAPVVIALGANLGDVVGTLTSRRAPPAQPPDVDGRASRRWSRPTPSAAPTSRPTSTRCCWPTTLAPWTLLRSLHDIEARARPHPRDALGARARSTST